MSVIRTNVSSLIAQSALASNNRNLETTLQRLSTGYKINSAKDNPSGLIASEKLRAEMKGLESAIGNAERADQVLNIAEGGLIEINDLLTELQGLVTEAANDAGLTDAEKEATQLQIDSILNSIDRFAETTNFQGVKLLNGGMDYVVSNVNSTYVADMDIYSAKGVDTTNGTSLNVSVTQSGRQGGLALSMTGNNNNGYIDLDSVSATISLEVAGAKGSQTFTFAQSAKLSNMMDTINAYKDVTGVSATSTTSNYLIFNSTDMGDDNFVSLKFVAGTNIGTGMSGRIFAVSANNAKVINTGSSTAFSDADYTSISSSNYGQDVAGTINGAKATGKGNVMTVNTDQLYAELVLKTAGTGEGTSFTANKIKTEVGGAKFSIGQQANLTNEYSMGLQSMKSTEIGKYYDFSNATMYNLGDLKSAGNANIIDGDVDIAQSIVTRAIDQVTNLRGRIGAAQANIIEPTISNLSVAYENTAAANSQIRDTDYAASTAALTRNQILVNAATSALGIANVQPSNVMSLLG